MEFFGFMALNYRMSSYKPKKFQMQAGRYGVMSMVAGILCGGTTGK